MATTVMRSRLRMGSAREPLGASRRLDCGGFSRSLRSHAPPRSVTVHVSSSIDPYKTLGLQRSTSIDSDELRKAYLDKIKELHPDLNPGEDTTELCSLVNQAYELLLDSQEKGEKIKWDDLEDFADGPANVPFINPFAYQPTSVDPLRWRELQSIVNDGLPPEEALNKAGLHVPSGAVSWLSKGQARKVSEALERMEMTLDFEYAAWEVESHLRQALRANARGPGRRGRGRNEPVEWNWVEKNGGNDFFW